MPEESRKRASRRLAIAKGHLESIVRMLDDERADETLRHLRQLLPELFLAGAARSGRFEPAVDRHELRRQRLQTVLRHWRTRHEIRGS